MRTSHLIALAGVAVTGATASPAAAAIVHRTPRVPIVVDGVRYAPQQIHRFDGRPLYMRIAGDGKRLIAYTKAADYRADLRRLGVKLDGPATARASQAGHSLKFCTGANLDGTCHTLGSGMGIANFAAISGCDALEYDCWNFVNNISSIQSKGQYSLLFDAPDFNRGGMPGWYNANILTVPPNITTTLSLFGFDNRAESAFMFW
jgi:hypothetical protein